MARGRKPKPNGDEGRDEPPAETAVAEPGVAQIFEAYRRLEQAQANAAEARAEATRLKEVAKAAKEQAQGLTAEADRLSAELMQIIGGLCPEAAPEKPLGWIDETTRPLRRLKLVDTEDRLEFRGIVAGQVQIHWYDGLLKGETFFPRNDVTVEQWNAEYAPKVEGIVDPQGQPPAGEGDDSWRAVLLESLQEPSIPRGVLQILIDQDPLIATVGDLADWTKSKGDFWAKDLKGIGPAAEGQITAALDAFWERRRKAAPPGSQPGEGAQPGEQAA